MFCLSQSRDSLKPTQAASILNRGHWIRPTGGQKSQEHLSLPPISCVTLGKGTHPSTLSGLIWKMRILTELMSVLTAQQGTLKLVDLLSEVNLRLLRVPWIARRSNQSILKEINPEYSLEGLMLKLKLQYFGHLMRRTDSLEKTLMLGKTEGGRRRGRQRMRWLDGIINSMDMSLSKFQEIVRTWKPCVLYSWGCKESDTTERLNSNNKREGDGHRLSHKIKAKGKHF